MFLQRITYYRVVREWNRLNIYIELGVYRSKEICLQDLVENLEDMSLRY